MNRKGKDLILSKSRLMRGIQCPKNLYLAVHQPELETPVSDSQQALFDQGKEVGDRARQEFPDGIIIEAPHYDLQRAALETEAAIKKGVRTIYEATVAAAGLSARIDILHRESADSAWHLIEVKSSTSVKPEHLEDVAIQVHVARAAGLKIEKSFLMHLNNQSTAPELNNLFTLQDVTHEITEKTEGLLAVIDKLRKSLVDDAPPSIDIGPHCSEPYDCPFRSHCWKHIPSPSIFEIPSIGRKALDLYKNGIVRVSDSRFKPSKAQSLRVEAIRSGVRWTDPEAIAEAMSSWKWPLCFLDFETIGFAIPRYAGTRPYQQVPFQFSCLVQEKLGGPLRDYFYLHQDPSDPRLTLARELAKVLSDDGAVVAYNKTFEAGCLDHLSSVSPDHSRVLLSAKERLVDPLPIFRSSVYDRGFKGSFSIKSVAPAILGEGRGYSEMEIPDGQAAQRAFVELIEENCSITKRREIREALLSYCRKDTQEMADLTRWLFTQFLTARPAIIKQQRA